MQSLKNILLFSGFAFFLFTGVRCNSQKKDDAVLKGYVVAIADGDTFTLLTDEKKQVKIRLYGIDCPEKKQPFGTVAKQKLSELIFNKNVLAKKISTDRYKRTVAIVYDENKVCINEIMLRSGLAWHYTKYDNNIYWQQLQDSARKNKSGLWVDINAIPPWQWRAKKIKQ